MIYLTLALIVAGMGLIGLGLVMGAAKQQAPRVNVMDTYHWHKPVC